MNILIIEKSNAIKDFLTTEENSFIGVNIQSIHSYKDAHRLLGSYRFHILIIDINLNSSSPNAGLRFVKQIRSITMYESCPIIIVSSSSIDVAGILNCTHCHSFFTRPYSEADFLSALRHAVLFSSCVKSPALKNTAARNGQIPSHKDIIWIEAQGHTLFVHTETGILKISSCSLSELCSTYPALVRCHKSYAVNSKKIISQTNEHIILKCNDETISVPIGRKYR